MQRVGLIDLVTLLKRIRIRAQLENQSYLVKTLWPRSHEAAQVTVRTFHCCRARDVSESSKVKASTPFESRGGLSYIFIADIEYPFLTRRYSNA